MQNLVNNRVSQRRLPTLASHTLYAIRPRSPFLSNSSPALGRERSRRLRNTTNLPSSRLNTARRLLTQLNASASPTKE